MIINGKCFAAKVGAVKCEECTVIDRCRFHNQTNPILQARANGIKINQPNVKEELEEVIKIVTEENKKAATSC